MDWVELTAIGTDVGAVVLLIATIVGSFELDHMARDRFVNATNVLFQVWESPDFQRAQLWILNDLKSRTWHEFVREHRGKYGEQALITVGSYYNHIGTLTREHLIPSPRVLLRSIGGYAIAVWERIRPIVEEARKQEISTLFEDYEWLVAAAYQVYKPEHPVSQEQRALAAIEEAAGTVGGEERPGLRLFRGLPKRHRHHS